MNIHMARVVEIAADQDDAILFCAWLIAHGQAAKVGPDGWHSDAPGFDAELARMYAAFQQAT